SPSRPMSTPADVDISTGEPNRPRCRVSPDAPAPARPHGRVRSRHRRAREPIKEVTVLRRVIIGLCLVASLGVVVVGTVVARNGALPADLQAVRAAVAKYHDYANA